MYNVYLPTFVVLQRTFTNLKLITRESGIQRYLPKPLALTTLSYPNKPLYMENHRDKARGEEASDQPLIPHETFGPLQLHVYNAFDIAARFRIICCNRKSNFLKSERKQKRKNCIVKCRGMFAAAKSYLLLKYIQRSMCLLPILVQFCPWGCASMLLYIFFFFFSLFSLSSRVSITTLTFSLLLFR